MRLTKLLPIKADVAGSNLVKSSIENVKTRMAISFAGFLMGW